MAIDESQSVPIRLFREHFTVMDYMQTQNFEQIKDREKWRECQEKKT